MNKQPYYHRAVVLFTAMRDVNREELTKLLSKQLKGKTIIEGSAECEEVDSEPGDPDDLM